MPDDLGIVFIGPPGAGPRNLARLLCEEFNLDHLSAGNLPLQRGSSSGRQARVYVTPDGLLPDELVIGMAPLAKHTRFLLDGFPQTLAQAHALT